MILTTEERNKFAAYMDQCAKDEEVLICELEKNPASYHIVTGMKIEVAAERLIARKLRSTRSA